MLTIQLVWASRINLMVFSKSLPFWPVLAILFLSISFHSHGQLTDSIPALIKTQLTESYQDFYTGNTQTYAQKFSEQGVYYEFGNRIEGQENILKNMGSYKIPTTTFQIDYNVLEQVDNNYLVSYILTEEGGPSFLITEIWKTEGEDLKILYASIIDAPNPGRGSQMTANLPLFVATSIGLGIFLFLFLLILKNAFSHRKKNE
ncbi:hypothetical protein [Algoriphagus halophilus]|uniref:Uncharacterized protein n=1 Tax=Algoriphagus halophilus TaxID=226505 RepID=A0A1N6D941_9BACT|nr:hypothetical protein [Algoriphagus halophilus]SIN67309.1 hypothetical protein SAMN05444394_0519 [Algoriphagus halophilus]